MDEGADDSNLQLSCEESQEETGQPSFSQVWPVSSMALFWRTPPFPFSPLTSTDYSIGAEQVRHKWTRRIYCPL